MKINNINFREDIKPADTQIICEIVESCGFFYPDEVEIAVELIQERLNKGLSSGYEFLFAEQYGRVVGYTCFGRIPATKHSYDLYWVVVHKDFQGLGFGYELLKQSEFLIAKRGGSRIYIETSSRDVYKETHAFYKRCGYKETANLQDFYDDGDAKVIYLKEITPL